MLLRRVQLQSRTLEVYSSLLMKHIVSKPLEIWADEDMTAGHQELPAGTVVEETRATQHRRSDALWLRFDGKHCGYALEGAVRESTVEATESARKQERSQQASVHFSRYVNR